MMAQGFGSESSIINLNVGGSRFATSKQTLSWIPDTFFTSLLSGRIPTVRDETGAIFIDRDPEIFRVILHYLRTRQVDLSGVNNIVLKHEAQFYGLAPLVKRLTLCEELEMSNCGNVLFHALIPIPRLPNDDESSSETSPESSRNTSNASEEADSVNVTEKMHPSRNCDPEKGSEGEARREFFSSPTLSPCSSCHHSRATSADLQNMPCSSRFVPSHYKRSSYDLNKFIRSELSALKGQQQKQKQNIDNFVNRERALDRILPSRVRLMRAHHNSLAVAYPNNIVVYRMKESVGWQSVYVSPRLHLPVLHLALNSKFGSSNMQGTDKMLAMSFTNGTVDLWNLTEAETTGAVKVGRFKLGVTVDKLFFIGSQLVALGKSGRVGIWHSMTQNWQVQDIASEIECYDTAGSSLLLGCTNGSMYYIDMQKFPLRMKDNDLLVTELYKDPNGDAITAISVYLTPKTTVCGNWIEIAYGTSAGALRVIVQHPETVGHGPQLFQTYTVHSSPITKVALTTNHLISVCAEYNHVRTWALTRFRGMISTQPGSTSLASFKVLTLDSTDDSQQSECTSVGPYGDQEGDQLFVQRVVPDTNQLFVRLSSSGDRLCTIRSVDGSAITSFLVHECEGSTRIGCRPRKFLFVGTTQGTVQMWDLTTALDQYYATKNGINSSNITSAGPSSSAVNSQSAIGQNPGGMKLASASLQQSASLYAALSGPSPHELLTLIDECELSCASCSPTPIPTPHSSVLHLPGLLQTQHLS